VEFIDENPVVAYRARFFGRVEISERAALMLRDNHVVHWLVRTRCLPPSYHAVARDSPERYRFNVQEVDVAVPLSGELRRQSARLLEDGALESFEASEIDDLRSYLAEIGELHEGEPAATAVRRIFEARFEPRRPAPAPAPEPLVAAVHGEDDDIEVIAGPYRPERRSQRLLAAMSQPGAHGGES
jgi:hypothetical protein